MSGVILSLDPGLDCTGWALFRWPVSRPGTLGDYRPTLLASGAVTTPPDSRPDHESIPARADALLEALAGTIEGRAPAPPSAMVIETPAIFGPYGSRGPAHERGNKALGMARSMACLWYIIGRLEGQFHGVARIHRLKAGGKKSDHHQVVLRIWSELPATKTGPSEDRRDAVWLGLRWMEGHPWSTTSL